MRKLIVSTAIILFTGMAISTSISTAGIVDSTAPLKVKVVPLDGGHKIKVAKTLKLAVSCSKDCRAKVKIKLITPIRSDTVKGGHSLTSENTWLTGMALTNFGRQTLKRNVRRSRLKVRVSALDIATSKRTVKTRTFKFRR